MKSGASGRQLTAIAAGLAGGLANAVFAQVATPAPNYPLKPVRIIVGFPAGGGIDAIARISAQKFTEAMGQTFIVENRPGASGNIAAAQVAKSAADGYTLLMTADVHTISPAFGELPFDPVKDFALIGTLASGPQCIAVHPSLPARSLSQLVALAKSVPDSIAYASAGGGTLTNVAMELFRSMAGIRLLHISYKGSAASIVAVIAGEVPVLSIAVGQALPHAKTGKLRVLAVTGLQRTQLAPEIPTVAESAGLAGYEAISWQGLLAAAGTPATIVNKLNAEIEQLLKRRDVSEQLAARAWVPYPRSPAAFTDLLKADMVKWGKVVRESGVKAE